MPLTEPPPKACSNLDISITNGCWACRAGRRTPGLAGPLPFGTSLGVPLRERVKWHTERCECAANPNLYEPVRLTRISPNNHHFYWFFLIHKRSPKVSGVLVTPLGVKIWAGAARLGLAPDSSLPGDCAPCGSSRGRARLYGRIGTRSSADVVFSLAVLTPSKSLTPGA